MRAVVHDASGIISSQTARREYRKSRSQAVVVVPEEITIALPLEPVTVFKLTCPSFIDLPIDNSKCDITFQMYNM